MVDVSKAFVGHFRGRYRPRQCRRQHDPVRCFRIGLGRLRGDRLDADPDHEARRLPGRICCRPGSPPQAALGPIIPPSIVMVIYGSMTNLSIGPLFLSGAVPGVMIGLACMAVGVVESANARISASRPHADARARPGHFRSDPGAAGTRASLSAASSRVTTTATEAGVAACVYRANRRHFHLQGTRLEGRQTDPVRGG